MRHLIRTAVVVGTLVACVPARAQSGSETVAFSFGPGVEVLSHREVPIATTGQIVVSFHGDAASGCRAKGVCAYAGKIVWRPDSGPMEVFKLRAHRRVEYQLSGGFGLATGATLTSRVLRIDAGGTVGRCADATTPDTSFGATARHGSFSVKLLTGRVLSTRCAGPQDDDLGPAGPIASVPVTTALRGRATLDLRSFRTFSGRGFAGTVVSTVVMRLGPSHRVREGLPPGLPIKFKRMRDLTETLTSLPGRGQAAISLRGSGLGDVCELLDACGLAGALTLDIGVSKTVGVLDALGPASLPVRDYLVALGLRPGRAPSSISVTGFLDWNDMGSVQEQLSSPIGCVDSTPLGAGQMVLIRRAGSVSASFGAGSLLRTRCPGPFIFSDFGTLLSGRLSRAAFERRSFTLALRTGSSFTDDGYAGTVTGDLPVTLRRGRVTQRILTLPF